MKRNSDSDGERDGIPRSMVVVVLYGNGKTPFFPALDVSEINA
jgi:hypothetical protein